MSEVLKKGGYTGFPWSAEVVVLSGFFQCIDGDKKMTDRLCWEEQFNLPCSLLKCTELSGSHGIGILSFSPFFLRVENVFLFQIFFSLK